MKLQPLNLDELIDWLIKLRKSQEGFTLTNVDNIEVTEVAPPVNAITSSNYRIINIQTR